MLPQLQPNVGQPYQTDTSPPSISFGVHFAFQRRRSAFCGCTTWVALHEEWLNSADANIHYTQLEV